MNVELANTDALPGVDAELIEHLNVDREDAIVLIARALTGHPAATHAAVTAIDRTGADVEVVDPEGRHRVRVGFGRRIDDLGELTGVLVELVLRARAVIGDGSLTSVEHEIAERGRIRTFLTEVVAVEDVHHHLRKITVGGGDLVAFEPCGPDTFLYLLLPPPGRTALTIDRDFTWEAYEHMPEAERPVGAYYTVRAWRPEVAEVDLLVAIHGGDGPASAWAATAAPGDPVALWGPRTAYHPPADTDWYLLVGDETGLPAVAVILESLPSGAPARVVAEVGSAAERHELPARPGVEVHWIHRDEAPPGTARLVAAVRELDWPDGRPYVWGGAESRALTAVRRHVRDERGLPREAVSLVAYWRQA